MNFVSTEIMVTVSWQQRMWLTGLARCQKTWHTEVAHTGGELASPPTKHSQHPAFCQVSHAIKLMLPRKGLAHRLGPYTWRTGLAHMPSAAKNKNVVSKNNVPL